MGSAPPSGKSYIPDVRCHEPRVNSRNLLEVFQYLPHFIFQIFDNKGLVIFHFIKLYVSYNGRSPLGLKPGHTNTGIIGVLN